MSRTWIDVAYLVAAICLVIGIKRLSHPRTARSGNHIAAAGMAIAVGFTFAIEGLERYWLIVAGMAIGDRDRRRSGAGGANDRDAADGGALQRRRRRSGSADRSGRVPPHRGRPGPPPGGAAHRDPVLGRRRLHQLLGEPRGVREAAGARPRPADPRAGTEPHDCDPGADAARRDRAHGGHRAGDLACHADARGDDLRLPLRAADRRRRHAGRDLAPERVHRAWRPPRRASCSTTRR